MEERKGRKIVLYLLIFFTGAFFGFLVSPVKGGFGNNSGNNTYNNFHLDEPEEEAEEAEVSEEDSLEES